MNAMNDDTGLAAEHVNRTGTPLGSALAILRCFTPQAAILGVTEIASLVGQHKSTVSRTLSTLEAEGLVERDSATGKFQLGLGLLELSAALLADLDVRRVARPVLARLTDEVNETSSLLIWNEGHAISVEHVPAKRAIRHETQLGTIYATTASSSVRAFLAGFPAEECRAMLANGQVQPVGSVDEVLSLMADESAAGVFVNDGQTSPEEVGVSAPVVDRNGDVVAVVLVAAPRSRVDGAVIKRLGSAVTAAAEAISRGLAG